MPRLSRVDHAAVLEALRSVYAQSDLSSLREHMVRAATGLVPCDWGTFNEWSRGDLRMKSSVSFPDVSAVCRPHFDAFQENFHQHPVACANRTSGCGTAQKISDYATLRQLESTALYGDYYRLIGLRYQFVFSVGDDATTQRWLALNRRRCDFSERDRGVLDLLRPHLVQALQNVDVFSRLRTAAATLEDAQEATGEGLLAVNAAQRIEWASRQAREWISLTLGVDLDVGSALPEVIVRWLRARQTAMESLQPGGAGPLWLKGGGRTVVVHCLTARPEGGATLSLRRTSETREPPCCAFPELTPRENEIVAWIAHGKSNPEIAAILGLSVRTVYKHVENIFPKLGVENRAAAMLRVLSARQ